MQPPRPAIKSKAAMYSLLAAGSLGNTIPQYFAVADWRQSGDDLRYGYWGVRSQIPGGPCRLYCPTAEVEQTAASFGCDFNISMMIDAVATVTLWADIWESPTGLMVYGIEYPPRGSSWRSLMPTTGRHWYGLAAKLLLQKHLNANSYSDVAEMLQRYDGHVLELSATEECIGRVPHRNHTTWEIRDY
jgi:hypothetical protein